MKHTDLYKTLEQINKQPKPYEFYTAESLWNDPYISKKMLELHLDPNSELASRNKKFINQSIDWIADRFNLNNNTKICDFGCGPGIYTTEFAEKGSIVTGIDFSKLSIAHAVNTAKQNNLNINYINQNYLDFSSKDVYDLITMIYCDFCALNNQQRKMLLNKFYQMLCEDGFILLDVYSINKFNSSEEKTEFSISSNQDFWSNFWSDNPYYVFTNNFKYNESSLLLDKYTIIEQNKINQIFNWLKCFDISSLTKELNDCGFKVVEQYSNVAGEQYNENSIEIAVIAQKQ